MGLIVTCDLRTPPGLARVARWADVWRADVDIALRPAPPGVSDVRVDGPDGRVTWNARALAELRRGSAWAWLAPIVTLLSLVTRGESLVRPLHAHTRSLVLRVIGLATVCAARSWWSQAAGLVGSGGITPAAAWLGAVRDYAAQHHQAPELIAPTWLWLDASDAAIDWTCALATRRASSRCCSSASSPSSSI